MFIGSRPQLSHPEYSPFAAYFERKGEERCGADFLRSSTRRTDSPQTYPWTIFAAVWLCSLVRFRCIARTGMCFHVFLGLYSALLLREWSIFSQKKNAGRMRHSRKLKITGSHSHLPLLHCRCQKQKEAIHFLYFILGTLVSTWGSKVGRVDDLMHMFLDSSPLIEVGAGNGNWQKALSQHGVDIKVDTRHPISLDI